MLRQSFLICIFLSSTANLFCNGDHLHEHLTSPTKLTSDIVILSSDRRGDTFAVVDYQLHKYGGKPDADMYLRIENWKNHTVKKCSYRLKNWSFLDLLESSSQLQRLKSTNDKVALSWNDCDSGRGAFVIDLRTCLKTFVGPQDVFLLELPIVVPTNDGGLDLFFSSKQFCKDAGERCVVRYNSNLEVVGQPKPFKVYWYWSDLHIEVLQNGNYLVSGTDGYDTFYKATLIDSSTGEQTNLLTLDKHTDRWFKVYTSGLSFCWNSTPLSEKPIRCSQFDDKGELIFSKSLNLDQPVWPVLVREIANGEVIVLGKDMGFSNDEKVPGKLKWAKVSKRPRVTRFGYVRFNCTAHLLSRDLIVYDVWQSGELTYLGYACRNGDHYIYDVTSF